ncbi:YciI family protein [Streptomyces sp. NBC_00243]|uniref:YciI family protein n=1 Tax=Streptomyces sp. NBC_00243 TaxID=2975688 RepID=UPI002DD97B6A|nr:YciI family protein [Streptomyces sp. NBC_00243]WRZ18884.1 YciI family protein [Streptomyces sp. NBC_00243]
MVVHRRRHVRVRGDEVLLSDGPFVESKEYVAGIDIVEVTELDEAISLASRHPAALGGGSRCACGSVERPSARPGGCEVTAVHQVGTQRSPRARCP